MPNNIKQLGCFMLFVRPSPNTPNCQRIMAPFCPNSLIPPSIAHAHIAGRQTLEKSVLKRAPGYGIFAMPRCKTTGFETNNKMARKHVPCSHDKHVLLQLLTNDVLRYAAGIRACWRMLHLVITSSCDCRRALGNVVHFAGVEISWWFTEASSQKWSKLQTWKKKSRWSCERVKHKG